MGWVRLSDDFYDHPKLMAVGPHAELLYVRALAWSNRNLTDGHIPYTQGRRLADFAEDVEEDGKPQLWQHLVARLVNTGLWTTCGDGWEIHDYHDYQRSADEIHRRRIVQHEQKVLAGKRRAAGASRDPQGRLQNGTSKPANPADNPPLVPAGRQHPDQQNTHRFTSPNPNPNPNMLKILSSKEEVEEGPQPTAAAAAAPNLIDQALAILADRRPPGTRNPTGYRRAVIDGLRTDHAETLTTIDPDGWTPQQLADHLEPPPPASPPPRTDFAPGTGHLRDFTAELADTDATSAAIPVRPPPELMGTLRASLTDQ